MKKLLILAITLRLLVAGFLFHPDIKTYNFQASFLKKGVINIYSFLVANKKTLPLKEEFVYFPLTYFAVGGYQALVSPILGNRFDSWLQDAGANSVVANPQIFKYLLVLKFPYLVLDIAIAFILLGYFADRKKREKVFVIWLFNPLTIFLIYVFSNIDLFPVVLTLLAFWFAKKERLLPASLFLGLAACFKLYPLLFLPFLFLAGKGLKEKLVITLAPVALLGLTILPVFSPAFVQSALISGLTTRVLNPGFVIVATALFFYAWLIEKKIYLFNYWLIFLLLIFSFANFHITWLLWMAPFLVIWAVEKPLLFKPIFLLSLIAVLIPLFYEDRSMTISLFRIYSTWYDLLPTPFVVLQKFYDPYSLVNVLHSALAGGTLVVGYKILKGENHA